MKWEVDSNRCTVICSTCRGTSIYDWCLRRKVIKMGSLPPQNRVVSSFAVEDPVELCTIHATLQKEANPRAVQAGGLASLGLWWRVLYSCSRIWMRLRPMNHITPQPRTMSFLHSISNFSLFVCDRGVEDAPQQASVRNAWVASHVWYVPKGRCSSIGCSWYYF